MNSYLHVAIVTLLACLVCFWMSTQVSLARRKTGISAPATTGDPLLERTIRAHHNTLEWMPLFLPSIWLFAIYWNATVAAAIGVVWIIARIAYFLGYVSAAKKRARGYLIQSLAVGVLIFGSLGRLIYLATM
jgi:glutathione S-transferase